jgi:hypothetical protein
VKATHQAAPSPSAKFSLPCIGKALALEQRDHRVGVERLRQVVAQAALVLPGLGVAVFSLASVTVTPGISTALLRSRCISSAMRQLGDSKYLASGQTRTLVPCLRSPAGRGAPPGARSRRRREHQARHLALAPAGGLQPLASALVTLTPTPCRPPEKL